MNWPTIEGRYDVGNIESPVAVCTNASIDNIRLDMEKIAIAGKCVTENIGIEKIIKNIISNPSIRFLIICGKPSKGHFVGQALLSLKQNSIDSEKRIIGAKGNMPFLKNCTEQEIQRFRNQVEIIDMIGEENPEKIMKKVEFCIKKNPGKFSGKAMQQPVNEIQAVKYEDFIEDPSGYFIIELDKKRSLIVVEHYKDGKLNKRIAGDSSEAIRDTITKLNLIKNYSRAMQHGIYLGKELAKAELALKYNLSYEQDADLKISISAGKEVQDEQKRGDRPPAQDNYEWHD